jgi:hypothetical protein
VQPLPKISPWKERLDELLRVNAASRRVSA